MATGAAVGADEAGDRPDALTVTFVDRGSRDLVVRLGGHLDVATAAELDDRLRERLARSAPQRILLDLSGLQFLGSAGVAVLLRLRRWCDEQGCAGPRLTGATGAVDRMLHLLDVEGAAVSGP